MPSRSRPPKVSSRVPHERHDTRSSPPKRTDTGTGTVVATSGSAGQGRTSTHDWFCVHFQS
eukprot:scaffold2707_cov417-Prasinococcus_capsulatus_cf.AAC.14